MPSYADAEAYRTVRDSTLDLLAEADASGDEPVPACPGWTVRDLLAHLVGLAGSWLDGTLEVYASPEWTAGHVAAWSSQDVDELEAAWRTLGDRLAEQLDDFEGVQRLPRVITTITGPAPLSTFPSGIVIDALLHQHDLAGALQLASVDHPFQARYTRVMVRGAGVNWRRAGQEPVAVVSSEDGPLGQLGVGDPTRSVTGTTFDLFRSLGGRRTLDQVASLSWEPTPPSQLKDFIVRFFQPPAEPIEPGPNSA